MLFAELQKCPYARVCVVLCEPNPIRGWTLMTLYPLIQSPDPILWSTFRYILDVWEDAVSAWKPNSASMTFPDEPVCHCSLRCAEEHDECVRTCRNPSVSSDKMNVFLLVPWSWDSRSPDCSTPLLRDVFRQTGLFIAAVSLMVDLFEGTCTRKCVPTHW